jgi:hypothetical protein
MPVAVEPLTENVTTIGRFYGPDHVEFDVAGSNAELIPRRGGDVMLYARKAVQARVTVQSREYETPAGSRHRATITERGGRTDPVTLQLEADDKARLRFTRPFLRHTVVIEPITRD